MITPLPCKGWDMKPGSATRPFFGVQPVLLTPEGVEIEGEGEGLLAVRQAWPSTIRDVLGDYERKVNTYFPVEGPDGVGYYMTGDGARRDADGYFWITGRVDDVINTSGHRIGTAEVESALVLHPLVAEAAVVGFPHPVKGEVRAQPVGHAGTACGACGDAGTACGACGHSLWGTACGYSHAPFHVTSASRNLAASPAPITAPLRLLPPPPPPRSGRASTPT